jgi:hypothetical protein
MLIFKPHLQVVILIDHIILTRISRHAAFCLLHSKCKNDYRIKQALTALERQIRYAHNAGGLRRMLAAIVLQGCSLAPRPRTDTADGKRYALIQNTTSAGLVTIAFIFSVFLEVRLRACVISGLPSPI